LFAPTANDLLHFATGDKALTSSLKSELKFAEGELKNSNFLKMSSSMKFFPIRVNAQMCTMAQSKKFAVGD
jgi:hypothetical protein